MVEMRTWAVATASVSVFSACIQVSGQPPVAAQRFVTLRGEAVMSAGQTRPLSWFLNGSTLRERLRCHNMACRTWMPLLTPQPAELGWVGFCPRCVADMARICRRLYHRLPDVPREFFCPYCLTMRRDPEDRCSVEPDGRMRIKCWPCRQQDIARKNQWARERAHRARA